MLHRKQVIKLQAIKEHREKILEKNDFQKVAQIDKQII